MAALFRTTLLSIIVIHATAFAAFAENTSPHEAERPEHYGIERPQTAETANTLYRESYTSVHNIIKEGKLAPADLEAIHKVSYGLEAAVDAFRALKLYPESNIDNVDEAVQALHYASENHDAAKTREWLEKLETANMALTSRH